MSFIGILTEQKNEKYLKTELEKELEDIYFFSEKTVDNLKNIKFETILIGKEVKQKENIIQSMLQKAKYLIINGDIKENSDILDNLNLTVVTYGYNQKSTITVSSVEENRMMICVQRAIQNALGMEIEPQELEIDGVKNVSEYAVMELVSLMLLYKK